MPPGTKAKAVAIGEILLKALVGIASSLFIAFCIGSYNWSREITEKIIRVETTIVAGAERFDDLASQIVSTNSELSKQRDQVVQILHRLTKLEEDREGRRRVSDQFGAGN